MLVELCVAHVYELWRKFNEMNKPSWNTRLIYHAAAVHMFLVMPS